MKLSYDLTDLSRLPVSGSSIADAFSTGMTEARHFWRCASDCPYGPSRDPQIRARRIAWRVAFRLTRELHERAPRGLARAA